MIEHFTRIQVSYDKATLVGTWTDFHPRQVEDAISIIVSKYEIEDDNYYGGSPASCAYCEILIPYNPELAKQIEQEIIAAIVNLGWEVE